MTDVDATRQDAEVQFIERLANHTYTTGIFPGAPWRICACGFEIEHVPDHALPLARERRMTWAEHVAEVLGVTHKGWDAYLAERPR
jgi:hypothetical protein